MSFFAKPTPAPAGPSKQTRAISVAVAALFVAIAVAQLFTYEDFPAAINGLWRTSSLASAHILAASLVACEVFALPFFLSMQVSPLMRAVSQACGWYVAFAWLATALWQLARPGVTANVGMLGATIPLNEAGTSVLAVVLAAGVAYISYLIRPFWRKSS